MKWGVWKLTAIANRILGGIHGMDQADDFLAVCGHRNFSYAASVCSAPQPSLTATIRSRVSSTLAGRALDPAHGRLYALRASSLTNSWASGREGWWR